MAVSAPQPSVLHLLTIFRQITAGEIRIPAFQREFVWREKQVIELLESVLEGFPIGSILLWSVDNQMLKIAPSGVTSFPTLPESYPTAYVLDGMQRLSTLYGVFYYSAGVTPEDFNITIDLKTRKFAKNLPDEEVSSTSIPLAYLFSPRQLLIYQGKISAMDGGDELLENLLEVQAAFQDYMIPVVTIRSTDVHRIVGIFEKINSTGTRLDPVDFMRAITWAEDFDLNHYLEATAESLLDVGFQLSSETIIKCVGLVVGVPPTTEGLLQLRDRTPDTLKAAFTRTVQGMHRVSQFVSERFQIRSADLIPYEGQLLLLFRTIGMSAATEPDEFNRIENWFWAIGFNESLRGKPDHYVVRAVEDWRGLIDGKIRGLEPRLKITSDEFFERRLVSGAALSSTFAVMHAAVSAKNLADGSPIAPEGYLTSGDLGWFEPIFTKEELAEAGIQSAVSTRVFSNVILVDRSKGRVRAAEDPRALILAAADREDWNALESQFISQRTVADLRKNDALGFLASRAGNMTIAARGLVSRAHSD